MERENLAEIFHKIILNNIITGKSFTKKAEGKLKDMQDYMAQGGNNAQKIKNISRNSKENFAYIYQKHSTISQLLKNK